MTEKVLYEIESPASGTVAKLLYPVEAVVPVGQLIASVGSARAHVAPKTGLPHAALKLLDTLGVEWVGLQVPKRIWLYLVERNLL